MLSGRQWMIATLLVALLAGIALFWNLGGMPLTDRDEGEYASAVSAMQRSGDYLVPTLNGKLYLEKPIFIYWAMLAADTVAGPGEFAARLPSALSGLLLVLAVSGAVFLATKNAGLSAFSAAALAFNPLFLLVGRACLTDMTLSLFTTLSLLFFYLATEKEAEENRNWYLAAWAFLGLGFLTKGPVAPAVVLPTAFLYALFEGRLLQVLKQARIHWGLLIILVINLPWYGYMLLQPELNFWESFFVSQNIRRFSEVLLGHGGGFVYYLPVIILGMYPFAPAGLAELGRSVFRSKRAARAEDAEHRFGFFAGLAFLVVFVVFSLAATKQINYILPGLPFLAFLSARFFWAMASQIKAGKWSCRTWSWLQAFSSGLLTLVMIAVPIALYFFWDKILGSIRFDSSEYALPAQAPVIIAWPLGLALCAAAVCLLHRMLAKKGRVSLAPLALTVGGIVFSTLLVLGMLPHGARIIQEPAKSMALKAGAAAGPEGAVITFGLWKPSLFYYMNRNLERVRSDDADRLSELMKSDRPVWVLTRARLTGPLTENGGMALKEYSGYLLAGNQKAGALWAERVPGADKKENGSSQTQN